MYITCVYACVWTHVCHGLCVVVRDQLAGVCSLFYCVGPGDQTQVIKPDSLYVLSHLADPQF